MKTVRPYTRLGAALLLSASLQLAAPARAGLLDILRGPAPAAEPSAQPSYHRVAFVGPALVKEVHGQAELLSGIDRWLPLSAGARLEPGDIVRTGDGTVVLRMASSGSFVKMTPRTILRLAEFEQSWDRSVLTGREENQGFVVRSCRGPAQIQEAGGLWRPLLVNSVIAEGTSIRLEQGTVLDLFWNSEARPIRLQGQRQTILSAALFPDSSAAPVALAAK